MIIKRIIGFFAAACLSVGANAGLIFQDNFDAEAGGLGVSALNYTGFSNWTVSDGTVDVVANGGWGITCVGESGKCVDLDGSNNNAGIFSSTPLLLTIGNYTLSFDVSGNQRGGADRMTMTVGGLINESFALTSTDGWRTITRDFMVTSDQTEYLTFFHDGGDNIGLLLDNVALSSYESAPESVPEPATMSLFGLGLVGLAFARRRQRN